MIRKYDQNDWIDIQRVHDAARPLELVNGFSDAFLSLNDVYDVEGLFEYDVFVYTHKGVVEGFVAFDENSLGWLYVNPLIHGQGIGAKLVNFVIDNTQRPLTLEVMKSNENALSFYKHMGFEISDETTGPMLGNESFIITVYEMKYKDSTD